MLICLVTTTAIAQEKKKGYSRLYATFNPQYHLIEKYNVRNDNLYPDPIHVNNTLEYYGCIEYERTTKYGLILNGGLMVGNEKQDISIIYDVSNFNPQAVNALNGKMITHRFTPSIKYFGPRLSLGYKKDISKKWAVDARASMGMRYYLTRVEDHGEFFISYPTDDFSQIIDEKIMVYDLVMGKTGLKPSQQPYLMRAYLDELISGIFAFSMSINASYTIDKKWIKNITLGVEAYPNVWTHGAGFLTTYTKNKSYVNSTDGKVSVDNYSDKGVSIGLRLGVGLWK